MNYEQFRDFVNKDEFVWFIGELKKIVESYELLADQPETSDSQRLWYLAKAQGIKESINLPKEWLKNQKN